MIETSFAIWFIMFIVGMAIAAIANKTRGIRSFILLIGILIAIFGTIMICNSDDKNQYLGKPAEIKQIIPEKDFVLYFVYNDKLAEIQNPDTGEKILVTGLPTSTMKIGKTYFIYTVKGERKILESDKFPAQTKEKSN